MTNSIVKSQDMSLETLGQVMVKSGFFSDTKDAAQAIVKILAGQELGFGPIASMQGVYIVKGKTSLSANLVGAAIKRSGRYDYRVIELDETQCVLEFYENGKKVGMSGFTVKDAQTAGLSNGDNWRKFPRNMLFSRALTNGARWYCPDVFNGPIYTPDELGAVVDGETYEVVETPAEAPQLPVKSSPPSDTTWSDMAATFDNPLPTVADIYLSLPEAVRTMTDSDGIPYVELPTPALTGKSKNLFNSLRDNHLSDEDKATKNAKLDAIRQILKLRAANHHDA